MTRAHFAAAGSAPGHLPSAPSTCRAARPSSRNSPRKRLRVRRVPALRNRGPRLPLRSAKSAHPAPRRPLPIAFTDGNMSPTGHGIEY